jgi:hypothetical protein
MVIGEVVVVVVECMSRRCGSRREIEAGEVPDGDHPCCEKCGMPMVATKAIRRKLEDAPGDGHE